MRGPSGDDTDPAEAANPPEDGNPADDANAVDGEPAVGAEADATVGDDRKAGSAGGEAAENATGGEHEDDDGAAAASAGERGTSGVDATGADQSGTDAADIDPDELTVAERSLHPRIRILWVVRAALWALVLGGIATGLTWAYLDVTLLAPAALAGVLLVLFVTHAVLRYRAWRYEFREDAIYLERGVLRRVRTVVPFVRIQHVDTARGPIERVAGLSTLVVYTAGSRGADVTIPGIEADRASDHQRRLKQLAIAAEDDTAV